MEHFREKIQRTENTSTLLHERDKLYKRLKQLESDIQLWENNIGFFAKSKNADDMVRDVRNKIDKARADMAELIEKIKLIDSKS
jgi:putative ubiquitin-RnfH superfamily antitoxin RatB of RatAB toxin-antitoxin module